MTEQDRQLENNLALWRGWFLYPTVGLDSYRVCTTLGFSLWREVIAFHN
jgi:hypothetical protein